MNKKLLAAVVLGAFWSVSAQAENTGCGLGSMVWDGQSGIAPQVLAVTTNGTFGNQTFGITSGTLGCTQDGVVRSSQRLGMYTGSNMDAIARDMSIGQGESLEVLADLMGVDADDRPAFYAALQQNYDQIFSATDVTAEDVIAAIDATLRDDARLSRYAA
ncbi:MAG: DUF3015 domain-containing protein [Ectothiorhodospiraceae bacterium]|nr:DUF3015 domain-containing protein [Ectothiorhodospiraceae bacterium]MCH8503014.1 DUF3015 domain-containing protein [Ectothiorhodospiraceae bacterium]